jgi:O-antigen ligase
MTTLSLTTTSTRDRIDQAGLAALLGVVAAAPLSIFVTQVLLTVVILCWLTLHVSRGTRFEAPFFFWPLVGYAALTLLSAGFSRDPAVSFEDCKQVLLFLLVPLVYEFARGARARLVLTVALTAGAASALVGLVQYGVLNYDNLGKRLTGNLSHWMTYSGTLMLVICAALARLLYDTRERGWALVIMPALLVSVMLSFTRSAVVGVAAGTSVLFLLRDFRLLGLLPILAAIVVAVSPAALEQRILSMFDLNDPTSRDRVAMLQAGVAIIRDHPLTGVGPDMISRVYAEYRVPGAVQQTNPHLHNVPMQIAAERGLPALALWVWFCAAAARALWWLFRHGRNRALAAGGLAVMAAMLTAGLFEYNFGDSEFLMLFLVLLSLPFAADRDGGLP